MLLRVHVEHELRDRAMQARELSFHHHKARAGDLGRSVEIEHAEIRAQIDVVLHRKIELARFTYAPHLDVIVR